MVDMLKLCKMVGIEFMCDEWSNEGAAVVSTDALRRLVELAALEARLIAQDRTLGLQASYEDPACRAALKHAAERIGAA